MKERIKDIQRAVGAKPEDGVVGPVTIAAIHKHLGLTKSQSQSQFDERTEKNLSTLLPVAQRAMREWLSWAIPYVKDTYGVEAKVISGTRTGKEQDALYAKGRTAPGSVVTNARAGQSSHNYGLAIDLGLFAGGKYLDEDKGATKLVQTIYRDIFFRALEHGIYWGGNWESFPDIPHFQYGNDSVAEMKKKYAVL